MSDVPQIPTDPTSTPGVVPDQPPAPVVVPATPELPVAPQAPAQPTQVVHPWRATVRTAAAYVVAFLVALGAALPIVNDQLGGYLPENARAAILYVTGLVGVITVLLTRVMALPAVNELLTMIGLGADNRK